ncbi:MULTISPECIES: fimbrial protein [Providencia]|uniref:fimbrial protein n=2 Tax=Morganellaceae TaxID=1903414 RepID=UPI000ABB2716|nr:MULTISPECIES: fimbrial protein [Providencia]MBP6121595.1 type 1 fimbrial protein [Providencia sp.]NIH21002.1 type 1 fimbrial protein [Providencia heimbachae]
MEKIRKILFISLLINFQAIAASNVTLNFTGNIKAATCNISGGENISVDLKALPAGLFNVAQSGSNWTVFNINLINCSTYINQVKLTFTGTADPDNTNSLYKNQGTAKNIAVQLQSNANATPLGNNKVLQVPLNGQTSISIPLKTRAFSFKGNAVPGSISANVTATITYL